ncbi:unnamed protein product [Calypogeia fissa]
MKRSRENGIPGPLVKRPAGYNRAEMAMSEPAAAPPSSVSGGGGSAGGGGGAAQRLTTDDALAYLKAVKDMFKDDKDKYDEFLEVMKDFKAQRIDTAGVITRVKDLFRGHRALILGFNAFLPKGYEITLPAKEEHLTKKQPVEFDQAINYVNKIKTRFQNDEHVYKAFLEILNMYRKGNKSIQEVYQEVAQLFTQHADLVEEFTYFLPDSTGPVAPITTVRPGAANHASRSEEKPTGMPQVVRGTSQPAGEKIVKREKISSYAERDRAPDRVGDGATAQDRVPSSKLEKDQRKRMEKEKEKEKKDDSERRERGDKSSAKDAAPDEGKEKDLDASQRLPHKRKSARRADELIRKQSQAGEGGEALQGQSASPLLEDDKKLSKSSSLQKEQQAFFDKVKGRLRNHGLYQEFLKCLNIFSQEIISRSELQSLVADILGKHSDLMEGFNDFLSRRENLEGYFAGVFSSKKLDFGEGTTTMVRPKVEKEKEREREPKDWELESHMEQDQQEQRERERDSRVGFAAQKEVPSQKASSLLNKEKYSNKPISELDLSNWERCTPSYRLLPKSYPKPLSTHRTELARGVLNDSWVSVTSGSEDYSFKHMRKNQYEESLFRCEDDRFELDMLVESAAVTARRVNDLVEYIQDPSFKQQMSTFVLDDHLSAINLRCIERIYGDHGLDVIDLLRKNAPIALPVVLSRLWQKHEEWSRCRIEMNKVWKEVYSKNYHKSLDHRSFYFKQQDKKSLSTKSLIAEIKEIGDKKRREGSSAAGNRRSFVPELKFEYSDPSVHEDVYQIIKYSLEEVCSTAENSEKITRIWSKFFEPMFGVPARPPGVEDREEAAKTVRPERKAGSLNGGEVSGILGDAHEIDNRVQQTCSGENAKLDQGGAVQTASMNAVPMESGMDPESAGAGPKDVKAGSDDYSRQDVGKNEGQGPKQAAVRKVDCSETLSKGAQECEKHIDGSFPPAGGKYNTEGLAYSQPCTSSKEAMTSSTPFMSSAAKHVGLDADGISDPSSDRKLAAGEVLDHMSIEKDGDARPNHRHRSEGLASRNTGEINAENSTKTDREEGEMSPSPDLEDRSDSKYGHGHNVTNKYKVRDGMDTMRSQSSGQHEAEDSEGNGDRDGDADDEGEESASENMSEDGDVSDNDSADGDDGSRDEHDDEEEDEEAGQDGKAESEGEADGDGDQNHGERDRLSSAPSSDLSFTSCKPLAAYWGSTDLPAATLNSSSVVYGNDSFYVIFRLHQTLYERILSAKKNAIAAEAKWRSTKDTAPPNLYAKFMRVLYSLLDGSTDNAKFEDECRTIIGTQSYILFTLDKLIFKLVKQLQAAVSDDTLNKLLNLHAYEKSRGPGRFIDLVYFANAAVLLHDDNIYRFEHIFNSSACVIQLMEGGNDKHEIPANALEFAFSSYLNNFLKSIPDEKDCHRVFLARNKRKLADKEDDFALQNGMANVEVVNGLEYKISCNTSKVSYVLDTEDFFHRPKRLRRSDGARSHSKEPDNGVSVQLHRKGKSRSRQQRFRNWFDETSRSLQETNSSFNKVRSK